MQTITASASSLYQQRTLDLISDESVTNALARDAVAVKVLAKGLAPQHNDLVGIRLNLNILKSQKIAVQTIHAGKKSGGHMQNKGFYNGSVIGYSKVVTLKDAFFNVAQPARERIASGTEAKHPMASIDGMLVDPANHCFDGLEVRFNPKELHLFTDMHLQAIRYAEHVTIYANRAYCRGEIQYYAPENAPVKAGVSASAVVFYQP